MLSILFEEAQEDKLSLKVLFSPGLFLMCPEFRPLNLDIHFFMEYVLSFQDITLNGYRQTSKSAYIYVTDFVIESSDSAHII